MQIPDYGSKDREVNFRDLSGKTLTEVRGKVGDEVIDFVTTDGDVYRLWHEQDCCENVTVEDICGDFADIVGFRIVYAEEASSNDDFKLWPDGVKRPEYVDSYTWTFYRIATMKGQVVIRWYGTSNGYYSEKVSFTKLKK